MIIRSVITGTLVISTLTFAQAADSSFNKNVMISGPTVSSSMVIPPEIKTLKKQKKIDKPNTTWSKIKDLFM